MWTRNATSASINLMPSGLIKNVRATAALAVMDFVYQERRMGDDKKFTYQTAI